VKIKVDKGKKKKKSNVVLVLNLAPYYEDVQSGGTAPP
jgi:hypothetical protein